MKKVIITPDNAQTANFREVHMGNIAPGILYRSSHPIKDNKQEKIISMLANNARIAAVINLCDTASSVYTKANFAPWYNALLKNGLVIALGMDFSVASENFNRKLKEGLEFVIKTDGPYLIHCYAGVDRTGFVSMVLESFMGAVLDDVINDYLQSFTSAYESSIFQANKADSQIAMQILSVMNGSIAINSENLQNVAEIYLKKKIGLFPLEIELLKAKLAGIKIPQLYRRMIDQYHIIKSWKQENTRPDHPCQN